ncbi:alpha/beta fold hydrolase [Paracoccus fontiphilus]|uniref:Alpha/beta fold hydrolase n=1 Tax=Paracoccus fontiphilus TaxID=1815556 RepID=A0ABV7IP13_9RHOB|nr:alpha/beta hydrolase [Paracoccus fontiphilus]
MGKAASALVLVHGYLGSAAHWRDQIARFGGRIRVVAPDLPGFGARSTETAPDSIAGFAQDILRQLDEQGVQSFHLVGHSMGGMIAQEIAALAPARVGRLVLYGTGPQGALPNRFEPIAASRARIMSEGLGPAIERIVASWFLTGEAAPGYPGCADLASHVGTQAALAALTAMESWDGRDRLGVIVAPTLVLWGDCDRSYGWSETEMLWRGIPRASLAVVPGAAHNVHQEKPEIFNRLLSDFLELSTHSETEAPAVKAG